MSGLDYSVFKKVLFPKVEEVKSNSEFLLKKIISFKIDELTPLDNLSFCVFDFETTGLKTNKDKIIEIGAVRVSLPKTDSDSPTPSTFETLVNPQIPFSQTNISSSITGITEKMLEGKPPIQEVLPKFLDFITGSVLIAHNAEFDFAFLKSACLECGYELICWPCYCTLKMARTLHSELESKSLDALAQLYDLTFDARHRSVGDAIVTKDVLFRFIQEGSYQNLANLKPFVVV